MPVFTWTGRTRDGSNKKGVLEAANEAAVTAQLRTQGILPVKIKPKGKDLGASLGFLNKANVTTKELVIFTRQFATMIDAGLPLVQCLLILGNQQPNPGFKKVIIDNPKCAITKGVHPGSGGPTGLRRAG